jgi:serine/threonine protein phosphatase PrpC
MVDLALDRGSKDNISTIVIKFPEKGKEVEKAEDVEEKEAEAEGQEVAKEVTSDEPAGEPIEGSSANENATAAAFENSDDSKKEDIV